MHPQIRKRMTQQATPALVAIAVLLSGCGEPACSSDDTGNTHIGFIGINKSDIPIEVRLYEHSDKTLDEEIPPRSRGGSAIFQCAGDWQLSVFVYHQDTGAHLANAAFPDTQCFGYWLTYTEDGEITLDRRC